MFSHTHTLNNNPASSAVRRCARAFALFVALLFSGFAQSSSARTASAPAAQSSNRFLFIVETSKAMQRRTNAVLTTVNNLLATGMKGQLRPGDTIGLWTFNDALHDGRFPLQQWSPKAARANAAAMLTFLEGEKWEKQGKLAPVVPAMQGLIKDSDNLTVILISSGEDNIAGTPFDALINQSFNAWKADQKKQLMPFVSVFLGVKGQIVKAAVTPVPWEIDVPHIIQTNTPTAIVTKSKLPPPVIPRSPVPPLIVTGKKPPPLAVTNNVVDASATNLPIAQAPATLTNQLASIVPTTSVDSNLTAVTTNLTAANPISPTNQTSENAEANPLPSASTEQAVATPTTSLLHNKKLWIAFAGLLVLLAVLLVLSRRSQSGDRVSLITKSIDLKKK